MCFQCNHFLQYVVYDPGGIFVCLEDLEVLVLKNDEDSCCSRFMDQALGFACVSIDCDRSKVLELVNLREVRKVVDASD